MKQVVIKAGKVCVEEVPAPAMEPGMVLVRVHRSAISSGTESAMVSGGGALSLAFKHLKNPLSVEKLKRKFATVGIKATANLVRAKLADATLPGYSSAGTIVEVGEGVPGFKVGDRVACAGVGYACHAEYNLVPHQLVTPIPDGLDYDAAAFVAIGAIAMQGVRRAEPMLGETVAVLGLGLLGQITAGLLLANGCHVLGHDPRTGSTLPGGGRAFFTASHDELAMIAQETTGGYGVDAVIICAGTPSSDVVNSAFDLCRPKARVVVVGAVGMDLSRDAMYRKELDLRISCSYGPGRYDGAYEEKGLDYPIGYVRWTEGRNMAEYLRLAAAEASNPDASGPFLALRPKVFAVDDAERAYKALADGEVLAAAFDYGEAPAQTLAVQHRSLLRIAGAATHGKEIGVAVIGAGAFSTGVQLPALSALTGVRIAAIATRNGVKARALAERYRAQVCATDYRTVLDAPSVDAVLVSTRHHLHAQIALDAIAAGKHVFVEKPLALTLDDCQRVCDAARTAGVLVSVGFNRRLAPFGHKLAAAFCGNTLPKTLLYRCNAGPLPPDHWTLDPEIGGGRILGEAVHFFDFVRYILLSGAGSLQIPRLLSAYAQSGGRDDELSTLLRFSDGSTATVLYSVTGSPAHGKERVEIFSGGGSGLLDDFVTLDIKGVPGAGQWKSRQDKGHTALLENFVAAVAGREQLKVTAEDGLEATRIALAALRSAQTGVAQEF